MSEFYVGIDPGKGGAYSIIEKGYNGKNAVVEAERYISKNVALWLSGFYDDLEAYRPKAILLERAQASNQMGISSAFEYGRVFGQAEAIALLYGRVKAVPVYYCAPNWWKGALGVSADKKLSVQKALDTIVGLDEFVKSGADDGIAEAAMMATLLTKPHLVEKLIANNEKRVKPKAKRPSYRV